MTEQNQPPNPVDHSVVHWPQAPRFQGPGQVITGQGTSGQGMTDLDVDEALGLLSKLPDLEVAEHGAVYAELHDALLEALNSEALHGDSSSDDTRP